MKFKNLAKTFVLAFGTLAAAVAAQAGDIFEIKPLSGSCTADTALKSGQKFQFLMRLVARPNGTDDPSTWGDAANDWSGQWVIRHTGIGSEELDKLYPPKMGVVVSGKLRYADIVDMYPHVEGSTSTVFTDVICEYVVQPGDFALPVKLALQGSETDAPLVPLIDAVDASAGYFVKNVKGVDTRSDKWQFQSADGSKVCDFTWCSADVNDATITYWPGHAAPVQDVDLSAASFYVKSIDFDANRESDTTGDYWRIVDAGNKTTQLYQPRIETIGVADTNSAPTASIRLYVWSDNESAITLEKAAGATQVDMFVPNPDGSKPGATVKRWVWAFDLITGQKEYPFTLYGSPTGENGLANLILSSTKGYQYDITGQVTTNFITTTVPVKCGPRPAPSVRLSWDATGDAGVFPKAGEPPVVTYTNGLDEVAEKGYPIGIELRNGTFEQDVTFLIRAKMVDDATDDYDYVYTNKMIGTAVCDPGETPDSFVEPPAAHTVTFHAGDTAKKIWVYPVGSTSKASKGENVKFTIEFDPATPTTITDRFEIRGECTLRMKDSVPAVVSPRADEVYTAGDNIPVMVMDSYRDLTAPRVYTVKISCSRGELFVSNAVPFTAAGPTELPLAKEKVYAVLPPQVDHERTETMTIKVTDPLGQSASTTFTMTIPAKEKTPTVSATLYRTTAENSKCEELVFDEGQGPYVRFSLDPEAQEVGNDLYAFLVPRNWASTNLVRYAAATSGVLIPGGKTNSVLTATCQLNLLDGTPETDGSSGQLEFDIVLKKADGTISTAYTAESPALTLAVRNVQTVSEALYVNGAPSPTPNGGTVENTVSSGADQTFVAVYNDVSVIDETNGIVTVWCFTDGKKSNTYKYTCVTSRTDTAECKHKFNTAGVDQKAMFIPVDKDTLKTLTAGETLTENALKTLWPSLLKIAEPYTVTVHVGDAPQIVVTPEETIINEDAKSGAVQILLSEPYDDGDVYLRVKLTAIALENKGSAKFQQKVLKIESGAVEAKKSTTYNNGLRFDYPDLDGTVGSAGDGFLIEVEAYEDEDCTTPISHYAKGEGYVYVINVPPTITPPEPSVMTTNKTVAVNEDFTLTWSASDVTNDLLYATGLTAKWYIDDNLQNDKTVQVRDKNSRTTTLRLTSDGFHEVRLEVTDKDGEDANGKATRSWYYYIAPTKTLEIRATGPSSVTKTKYLTSGSGRVWANGIKCIEEDFNQTWTYNVKAAEAEVHAYGYPSAPAVYYDNGSLGGNNRDIAIDPNGDSATAGSGYYAVDGVYDNFFYCWAFIAAGESGGASTVTYGNPEPTAKSDYDTKEVVALDPYEDNKESFATRRVEAVFAREFLVSDNMGDVNLDGIPDLYVKKYGLGVIDPNSGAVSGDDQKPITISNNGNTDGDYLPGVETSIYSSLIPGLQETWSTVGSPFTAKLEIRGYGDCLNDAPAQARLRNVKPDRVYLDPDTCPTSTLSRLEFEAFIRQGGSTNDVTTWQNWSPERPTDPTLDDTDDDGFTDGYEYFFWYRAHVGYTEGRQHRYLTGRRYDPMNPAGWIEITAQEIEALFDPLAPAGESSDAAIRDSDNDGLPDLLEFELGTNPIDFDTDGDGLPDGYEVAITGTDPLLWSTAKDGVSDAMLNTDNDWMADEPVEKQLIFGLDNGRGGIDYYTFGAKFQGENVFNEVSTNATTFGRLDPKTHQMDPDAFYCTVQPLSYAESFDGTNTGYRLTKATTVWRCARKVFQGAPDTSLFALEPVKLPLGWFFTEIAVDQQIFATTYALPQDEMRYWKVWQWGRYLTEDKDEKKRSNWVFGEEFNHLHFQDITNRVVRVPPFEKIIHRLHYNVYQENGFDPRTGWKGEGSVKTVAYTHIDEFCTMAFFLNDGVLDLEEVTPTRSNPWSQIWQDYTTSPLSADTDEDNMPDGWEFYLMGGPKQYVTKENDPRYHERIRDYGPHSAYSPLVSIWLTDDRTRDNDGDSLIWPDEYVGSESGTVYPECPTITDYYTTWSEKGWRNKKWPTDPWNEDTDGDGLNDGEEGTHFIYGDPHAEGMAGGGLNPLSWDTDMDFLPDPWEAEFAGHYVAGPSSNKTEVVVSDDQSTTNTVSTTLTGEGNWEGGMNGTVPDAFLDYDQDGLDNWQEYMVGSMRCWHYDDTVSPWTNNEAPDILYILSLIGDEEAWGEYWYNLLVNEQSDEYNPHFVGGVYDNGASWFSICTNVWDSARGWPYMFKDGVYHDLRLPPDRYIFGEGDDKLIFNRFTYRAYIVSGGMASMFFWINGINGDYRIWPEHYICCDPTNPDTDNDGMDDYYELFHGLNPLLGQESGDLGAPPPPQDVVYRAYGGDGAMVMPPIWSAQNNYWVRFGGADGRVAHWPPRTTGNSMDFEIFPWLNGLAHADPDGDNIPNQQEAILPNLQSSATYLHTDPSPLWMTDSYDGNSLVWRYFQDSPGGGYMIPSPYDGFVYVDPQTGKTNEYKFADFPLLSYNADLGMIVVGDYSLNVDMWDALNFFYSFEENEGYDSDHDYLGDFEEGQGKTKPASDPQNFDDPLRRQAMYFGGDADPGFLQTPLALSEQVPYPDVASEARQNFLYYTVECWAKAEDVDPDKGLQTLVERVIQCSAENPGDLNYTRRNFLIGVKNGRWYTKFDSTGTDAYQPVEISDGPQATTNWTHVAATYDGKALRLYVDGICNNRKDTSIQPEHGLSAVVVNEVGEMQGASGQGGIIFENKNYSLISMLVGASAIGEQGIVMDYQFRVNPFAPLNDASNYNCYFKGYIDEVRVWDGARPASDIRADYQNRTRYNAKLADENRQVVYSSWRTGARRSPVSEAQLPPQLMFHFSFDHLPGAVRAADVLRSPAGFVTSDLVPDAKAIWSRPEGWVSPWWTYALQNVRSKIYAKTTKDCAWVPWIANTIAHLPRFDGTTLDSVYWSETYAGRLSAAEAGRDSFNFPRNGEVYSKWRQMFYNTPGAPWSMHSHKDFLDTVDSSGELTEAYRFAMRDRHVEGEDLLPMLGAFPKRISAAEGGMWDDQGAADAWAQTSSDADNNGLPDWWQAYARANYSPDLKPGASLGWDSTVVYGGVRMPAWQAYLRDLAAGMLPGGKKLPEYADTRDFDNDGLPDWWEEINGVQGYSQADADADPDNDGLSNYAEYVLGEVYPYVYDLASLPGYKQPRLDPQHAYSTVGQRVVDYFQSFSTNHVEVKTGAKSHFWLDEYFGEIATDHDFMEDWWENSYKSSYVSSKVYDPLDDKDEDGWSNWAECRAALWGGQFNAQLIDNWTGSDSGQHVVDYPEPIIGVRATYHGPQDVSGHQLVIRTISGQTPRVDATFVVPAELDSQTRYIGPFAGDFALHGHMSPGHLNAGSIVFERAKTSSDKSYVWNCDAYIEESADELGWDPPKNWSECSRTHTGTFDQYRREYARWPRIELEGGDLVWESFATTQELTPGTATVMLNGSKFGTVNCETGEYELDMSKFDSDFSSFVFRVTYTSRIGHEWPQTVYVSDTKELATGAGVAGNGHVREGRNTVEVFMDMDGNGTYDAGEPFGVARNVQIGWHKVPEIVVELKDASPIMSNEIVAEGAKDAGGTTTSITIAENDDGSVTMTEKTGAAEKAVAALTKTVRVVRESINGTAAERVLATKTVVVDDHPYLTEADVSTSTKPDLDWTWLVKDATKLEIETIDLAGYRVEEVVKLADGTVSNKLISAFLKEFPTARPIATAVAPVNGAPVNSASPKLSFSLSDEKATGYRLQIRKAGAASLDYDSGVQILPGRTGSTVGSSVCAVTPAIFVDAPVYSGSTTNHAVFADGTNYQWRVALYNAKYNATTDDSDVSSEWSAWSAFELDVANEGRSPKLPTGYGSATVAVRYYGPATNDLRGRIVVEAFRNADFRGQPIAQIRVNDVSDLRLLDGTDAPNAVLRGIEPGTTFFRAYLDLNDNGSRDKWESWGYVNMVGKGFKAIYNPDPKEVTASAADWVVGKKADVTIYIEDCDVNKDEVPDCLEAFSDEVSSEEVETEKTDWWEWAEADPEETAAGDVMAYCEKTMKLVTLWDGVDANVLTSYLLAEGQQTPNTGMSAADFRFVTSYEYGTLTGYGKPVTADLSGMKVYDTPKDVRVAIVHAQVYEQCGGFCPDTAVPGGQTNTKPFTAQDKALVLRYLEQTGRLSVTVPEGYKSFEDYVMNSGNAKLYEAYTLKPNVVDNDHDGIADGWELYVDANPLDASDRESDLDDDGVPLWLEYDFDPDTGLAHPSSPYAKDSDGDGVADLDFHDYLLWDAGGDSDGDGLSNYAEYVISCVFKYAKLDPRNPKTDGFCVDYFRKIGDLYLGEVFTDHDQVGDVWEAETPEVANRYVYDPDRDDDGDGWSNYAEFRAGTDPSRVADLSIENSEIAEYPQPMVVARIKGAEDCEGKVIVQAYPTNDFARMSASWEMSTANDRDTNSTNANQKVLGSWKKGVKQCTLSPSSIQPGSVLISAKDLGFKYYDSEWNDDYYYYGYASLGDIHWSQGAASDAKWIEVIHDVMREDDNQMGDLVYTGAKERKTVGWINYETGLMEIDYSEIVDKVLKSEKVSDSTSSSSGNATLFIYDFHYHNELINMCNSYFKVNYVSQFVSQGSNQKFYLTEAKTGHVTEGVNAFVAFVDEDGNGAYTPGEPFGVVTDVEVGWQGASFEVGLARVNAITPRIMLTDGASDRLAVSADATGAFRLEDPLYMAMHGTNAAAVAEIETMLSNRVVAAAIPAGKSARVRIVRYGVDNVFCYVAGIGSSAGLFDQQVLFDRTVDTTKRDYLSELDLLRDGEFDLDWNTLSAPLGKGLSDGYVVDEGGTSLNTGLSVSNMTYLVVIGEGAKDFRDSDDTNSVVRALSTMVTRRFEVVRHAPVAVTTAPVLSAARPTFKWSIPDEEPWAKAYGSSYTAFKLQILKAGTTTVVYDSGVRRAPMQAADGSFTWTAPVSAGDQTELGKIFSAAGNWEWRVAMYNAKFKPQAKASRETWSNLAAFSTSVGTQQDSDDKGFSTIGVCVKYTGPEAVLANAADTSTTAGMVRIQAYATADFSGEPLSQGYVDDVAALKDVTDLTANGRLIGLEAGTYYVRAYVDSNGNFRRDPWESWGGSKEQVTVTPGKPAPLVGLYIEDCDTDQDWLPDAWEYVTNGSLEGQNAMVNSNGKIVIGQDVYDGLIVGKNNFSAFLPGVSLAFFENLDAVTMLNAVGSSYRLSTIEAIRALVEKNIDPDSVRITSLTVDPESGKVILTVGAKATDAIGGKLLSPVYELPETKKIRIEVYRKENLATAGWGDPIVNTATGKPYWQKTISTGSFSQRIEIPLTGVDFSSGFYRVQILDD